MFCFASTKIIIVHSANEPYFLEWFTNESVDSLGKLALECCEPVTICKRLMWGCLGGSGSFTFTTGKASTRGPGILGLEPKLYSFIAVHSTTAFIVHFINPEQGIRVVFFT